MKEYDPDGADARAIEAAIEGVHVIRHDKCRLTVTRPIVLIVHTIITDHTNLVRFIG